MSFTIVRFNIYVTDGMMMDRTTSVPKSVLCYVLDKVRSLNLEASLFQSISAIQPFHCMWHWTAAVLAQFTPKTMKTLKLFAQLNFWKQQKHSSTLHLVNTCFTPAIIKQFKSSANQAPSRLQFSQVKKSPLKTIAKSDQNNSPPEQVTSFMWNLQSGNGHPTGMLQAFFSTLILWLLQRMLITSSWFITLQPPHAICISWCRENLTIMFGWPPSSASWPLF